MKRAGAQRGEDVPVKPRHRDAWGSILGQTPDRALSPGGWAPEQGRRPVEAKGVVFLGTSDDDLRDFPRGARHRVGYQLHLLQGGHGASESSSTPTIGSGCRQLQVQDSGNAYRVSYVASIGDTVYVLHCSQKQGPQTSTADRELGQLYAQMSELIRTRRRS